MKLSSTRYDTTTLDPSPSDEGDRGFFDRFDELQGKPALIDAKGRRVDLPDALYETFSRILALLHQGIGVTFVPHEENLTSQAAADILGVSRPYLIRLIEAGKIPCSFSGSHRRIKLQHVLAYMEKRDRKRHEALEGMTRKIHEAGLYDKIEGPAE
jgi:excisionase family DNA binding protein